MNSSANSSIPLPSPPPEPSDRDRFILLLLQQSRELLRSLPDSLEKSSSPFVEKLAAMSKAESAEHASILKTFIASQDEARASRIASLNLLEVVNALDKKLDASNQAAESDRINRERLEAKVDKLNSLLEELNGFAPP